MQIKKKLEIVQYSRVTPIDGAYVIKTKIYHPSSDKMTKVCTGPGPARSPNPAQLTGRAVLANER